MARWKKGTLDFDITCPVIDGEIEGIEYSVSECLFRVAGLDDPKLVAGMMEVLSPHLERVRKTNIDMRAAADSQIGELTDERDDLKDKLDENGREISRLEGLISDLRYDIRQLEVDVV